LNIIVTYYRDLEMWVRGHSRSLKVVPFESLSMVFYSPTIVTTAVSLAISQIFSIKEWPDLEIWVWGRSWSFKIARFDRLCTTFYWFAIATIAPSCTIFELFDVNAIGSRQISCLCILLPTGLPSWLPSIPSTTISYSLVCHLGLAFKALL